MLGKQSRLFCYDLLDAKDELDEKLEKSYHELSVVTSNRRENEIYDHLNQKACKSAQEHEEVILGLLYSLLTDSAAASKNYSTLAMIARDGMAHLIRMVEIIILEKLQKLQDSVKDQVFWLVRELVQTHVVGADILCYALLKQMPAGSTSRGDIWLVESLLHLLLDNRSWLESQPALVDSVLYTYLSLIPSHFTAKLATLREQETGLCVSLLRSKFMDRIQIGRDLIRLLQNVARIPEFSELWRDILQFPEKLSSQFTGVSLLATKRTSRRFISGRITPELEIKLNFLLSKSLKSMTDTQILRVNINCPALVASKKQPATAENSLLLEGNPASMTDDEPEAAITSMTDDEPAAVIASMTDCEPLLIASVTDGEPLPIASVTVNEPAMIESVAIREPVAIEPSPSDNPGPLRTEFAHILIHNMAHPIGQLVIVTSNQDSIGQQYQPTATNPIVTLLGQNTTATVLEQKPAATVLDQNPIATVLHTVQNGTD
eukprot:Em0006g990a